MKTRIKWIVIAVVMALLLVRCYPGMVGKVVDAETGEPIEGAVIMAEWTKTKGIGLTATYSYKVVEVKTNKKGLVWIPGAYSLANLGSLAVYKKGYVAWSWDYIFPDYRKRTNFTWCCFYHVFKLKRFKPEYSYIDHTSFIGSAIAAGFGDKKLIYEAIDWEEEKASKERDKRRRQQ